MDHLPAIGDLVKLFPAPLPDVEAKPGKPLPLRRVQDGAGNYGRFLPEAGAERPFDFFWHNALLRGDVVLVNPRDGYIRGTGPQAPTP